MNALACAVQGGHVAVQRILLSQLKYGLGTCSDSYFTRHWPFASNCHEMPFSFVDYLWLLLKSVVKCFLMDPHLRLSFSRPNSKPF